VHRIERKAFAKNRNYRLFRNPVFKKERFVKKVKEIPKAVDLVLSKKQVVKTP
jgi:hypothetical protein